MKITIDIHDELLARAKHHARETGQPLRAVVENGLRNVLTSQTCQHSYSLPDLRAGDPDAADPLEQYLWPELREMMHGDPGLR